MDYRGPGFPAFYNLAPTPSFPFLVSKLDRRHSERRRKSYNLLTREGEEEGEGAKSHDGEKTWSSTKH
jgi:hypothetical protein